MATPAQLVNLMHATLVAGVRIDNVAAYCRAQGISRRKYYRHRERIEAEGVWQERSRRPHGSPHGTSAELEAWICKLRADLGVDNGADHIRDALGDIARDTPPAWRVPARSTINRVLKRNDLLVRNPKKRPRSSYRRFSYAQPRDCYQIDATNVTLADNTTVAVFDVLDDCTRTLVACRAAPSETAQAAVAAITHAFDEYGAPAIVLSDNGLAFTNRFHPNTGPSRFSQAVTAQGTRLIHSSPYHPQTCGKVERHHQTLKKWLAAQPRQPATLPQLQRLLNRYRDYYNHHRRHSALPARSTPHQAWTNAPQHGSPQHLPQQTDAIVHQSRVGTTGVISTGTTRIGIGCAYTGQTLTIIRDGHHATVYNADGHPIGHADLPTGKSYVPLNHTEK